MTGRAALSIAPAKAVTQKSRATDPHRYEKRRFAHELAGFLEDARKQDLVGQLFIAAPPQMLGDLREEFSGELKKFVKAELPKDFSMLPPHQLEQHLDEILGRS